MPTRKPTPPPYIDDEQRANPRWWVWTKRLVLVLSPVLAVALPLPSFWALFAIMLVIEFDLHGLPIRLYEFVKAHGNGVRHENRHEGWYGYQGRTIRGLVDADDILWLPLRDLALPTPLNSVLWANYGPQELQRIEGHHFLSAQALQRYLNTHRTDDNRAMLRWLEREVLPFHEKRRPLLEKLSPDSQP